MSARIHIPRPLPKATAPSAIRAATASGGQSLDKHTQASMSARFGHDFSSVRIHTGHRAEESAQAIGANAYAHGSDIVFGGGEYNPGSRETEHLLAHELTHVVQQDRFGVGDWGRTSHKGDASEREADRLASQVAMGRAVQVQSAPQAAIARDEGDDLTCSPDHPDPVEAPTNDGAGGAGSAGYSPGNDGTEGANGTGGGNGYQPLPDDGNSQLSTPVNDVLGTALGVCGLSPTPMGTACTLAGGVQSATQGPTDPTDPHYKDDQFAQGLGLATTAGSLMGLEAAGPIGLVAAGGMAVGHGAEWVGDKMIEEGMQNNPGQFGPDPMDALDNGSQGY